jgi:hypothetical protein
MCIGKNWAGSEREWSLSALSLAKVRPKELAGRASKGTFHQEDN